MVVALNPCARVFDKLSILDAGRARGFTCATVQTFVDVLYEARIYRHVALFDANHLVDSAAR